MIDAGTHLGRYEIRSQLGAGGMGEVYRARDEKLNRDVAIKVLPTSLSQDQDRLRRFEQEAQAAGALNHPNILAVYDVGMHDGAPYIVSELLEGEELREQLNNGSLPQRKALDYAQQIAQGLAAAHERGITHRDLKPENLFVTTDGRMKILDFGLAKLRPLRNESVSSEIDTRKQITDPGTVMGTVGYMSPEQVRGHDADHRSDIFSFGSILYEMLAGQRAFRRDTMAETMTAILKEEPEELSASNPNINPSLERIVNRCLEKKPERRFQSTADLGFALESLSAPTSSSGSVRTESVQAFDTQGSTKRGGGQVRLWQIIAGALLMATIVTVALWGPWRTARNTALRFTPFSFEQGRQDKPVWSPDGKAVAFGASQKPNEPLQIYVRYLDSPVATQLTRITEGVVPIQWTSTGRIVFWSSKAPEGLWSVSPVGGEPEPLQAIDTRYASVSRDGSAVALFRGGADGVVSVWVSSPHGSEPKPYEPAPFASRGFYNTPTLRFSPDGKQILLIRNNGSGEEAWLMPYPANAADPPHLILQGFPADAGTPSFSWMPDSRHVVLSSAVGGAPGQLYIADTVSGKFAVFSSGTTPQGSPAVSPDGHKIVFGETVGSFDIVSMDLATAAVAPLIATGRDENMPAWAAKEPALVYVTDRNGLAEIWLHKTGQPDRPLVTAGDFPPDTTLWFMSPSLSPDAMRVIYSRIERGRTHIQLWMSAVGGGSPVPLTSDGQSEYPGSWSPDGNWFVYWSNHEDGRTSLNKVKTTGQAAPEVLRPDIKRQGLWVPLWSPTGEWILSPDAGVKLISPDGKTTKDVSPKSAIAYGFSADGKTIYGIRYAEADKNLQLFSTGITGGGEKVIKSFGLEYSPSNNIGPALRLSLTPDGKSVTYPTARFTTNLWLMDGLDGVALPR